MRYRLFGQTGLRVSEAALGTGTFGTAWGWGCTRDEAAALFGRFVDAGGNLFDCADGYQNGMAETMLGEFIRHDRDEFIVSTKYTTGAGARSISKTGNNRKAMMHGIEGSLRRLGTDYVDVFWVHLPDFVTPTDEIARGLEDVVRDGKARFIGFSDLPAWRVSRAATLAELNGWARPAAVQLELSLAERSAERELIPMADAYGMAVMVWAALGGGVLTGKYRRGETGRLTQGGGPVRRIAADREDRIVAALDAVAGQIGATPAQVAIAWVRSRETAGSAFIPIIGARTEEQLADNLAALDVVLDEQNRGLLDEASAIEPGFPHEVVERPGMRNLTSGGRWEDIVRGPRTVL